MYKRYNISHKAGMFKDSHLYFYITLFLAQEEHGLWKLM